MRCMMCESFSLTHICRKCREQFLTPSLHTRTILGSIPVHSFFPYHDIEPLLLSKHTDIGYYLYTIMAKQSFSKFAKAFTYDTKVASVGIDDHVRSGYSHTAILNKAVKAPNIVPYYGRLRAGEVYQYAGKSLDERLSHPRKFIYAPFDEQEVIVIDDIVTTGTTLSEAAEVLHAQGKKVLFCLTLTDAENK